MSQTLICCHFVHPWPGIVSSGSVPSQDSAHGAHSGLTSAGSKTRMARGVLINLGRQYVGAQEPVWVNADRIPKPCQFSNTG